MTLFRLFVLWTILTFSHGSKTMEGGGREEIGKRRRQVYREDVSPLLGGKVPSGAFDWSRLMFNNLDSRGISIPDGFILSNDRHPPEGVRSQERRIKLYSQDGKEFIDSTYTVRNPVETTLKDFRNHGHGQQKFRNYNQASGRFKPSPADEFIWDSEPNHHCEQSNEQENEDCDENVHVEYAPDHISYMQAPPFQDEWPSLPQRYQNFRVGNRRFRLRGNKDFAISGNQIRFPDSGYHYVEPSSLNKNSGSGKPIHMVKNNFGHELYDSQVKFPKHHVRKDVAHSAQENHEHALPINYDSEDDFPPRNFDTDRNNNRANIDMPIFDSSEQFEEDFDKNTVEQTIRKNVNHNLSQDNNRKRKDHNSEMSFHSHTTEDYTEVNNHEENSDVNQNEESSPGYNSEKNRGHHHHSQNYQNSGSEDPGSPQGSSVDGGKFEGSESMRRPVTPGNNAAINPNSGLFINGKPTGIHENTSSNGDKGNLMGEQIRDQLIDDIISRMQGVTTTTTTPSPNPSPNPKPFQRPHHYHHHSPPHLPEDSEQTHHHHHKIFKVTHFPPSGNGNGNSGVGGDSFIEPINRPSFGLKNKKRKRKFKSILQKLLEPFRP